MRGSITVALGLTLAAAAGGNTMQPRLSVATDRAAYGPEDSVAVSLTLTNPGADPLVLRFATGQRYDVELRDTAGRAQWRWGADMMFMQMLGEVRLAPGDSLAYQVSLAAPAEPGRYTIVGRITAMDQPIEASVDVTVEQR